MLPAWFVAGRPPIVLRVRVVFLIPFLLAATVQAQQAPATSGAASPPGNVIIDLKDALARAGKYGAQVESANIAAQLAHEDRVQAKAASLPSVSGLNQFIYTEGNGTPSGVFVANDGVHVYNEQLVAHEELLSFIRRGEIRVAAAAEAVARARADVAARGLKVTVIQDYYTIASVQRKLANAQTSLSEAQRFVDISEKLQHGGEVAHADVIKAQIQLQQRQRDVQDGALAVQKAKIALAVLIFPVLEWNYQIVDDLAQQAALPTLPEATAQAKSNNPDIRAAQAGIQQARLSVTVARYAYLPSLGLDVFYGIDANQFAAHTNYPTPESGRSTLPNYLVPYRQNLGYEAQATLNVPIWTWGSIHSKVKQASLRERQAELDLTTAQKQAQADLASAYQEAETASAQVASLRSSSDLSAESLRLALLRYQAGEATALEVADAQTTVAQARSAYDDGLLRYRVALATLETLTGNL